jgi:hypothetical protein
MDKNFYNSASAEKLSWTPAWFGAVSFDDDLVAAVKKWQKKHKIKADGLVGPSTYRRIWTERQSNISSYLPATDVSVAGELEACSDEKYIIHNGKPLPINWHKVVLWDQPTGLKSAPGTYYDYSGKTDRKPTMFVNHWDVCLSSASCAKVLANRGISVHFCIDNDGTIYQLLDTQHGAWHAGGGKWNHNSIGVEISNAYYEKYQDWYVNNGFGERPVVTDAMVRSKRLSPHLGFYDVQIRALKALWKAISSGIGIPLVSPPDDGGLAVSNTSPSAKACSFSGFISHYHLSSGKIDCAGLDIAKLCKE